MDFQDSYRKIRELKKALTEGFRKEYLGNLIQRKAERNVPAVEVRDVVLVGADNKKQYEWPLGWIMEMFPGKDGHVRVAKVKTSHGVLMRSVQQLNPLEVPTSQVFPRKPKPDPVPTEVPVMLKQKSISIQQKLGPVPAEALQDNDEETH